MRTPNDTNGSDTTETDNETERAEKPRDKEILEFNQRDMDYIRDVLAEEVPEVRYSSEVAPQSHLGGLHRDELIAVIGALRERDGR